MTALRRLSRSLRARACRRHAVILAIGALAAGVAVIGVWQRPSPEQRARAEILVLVDAAVRIWQPAADRAERWGRAHGTYFWGEHAPACVEMEQLPAGLPRRDPWGHPYLMDCVGCWANTPQIRSAGRNGRPYDGDDILASNDGGTFPEAVDRVTARLNR